MKKKSHSRAADKTGFSVALPNPLLTAIQNIAKNETRSRNGQIEKFLEEAVQRYKSITALKSVENDEESRKTRKAN